MGWSVIFASQLMNSICYGVLAQLSRWVKRLKKIHDLSSVSARTKRKSVLSSSRDRRNFPPASSGGLEENMDASSPAPKHLHRANARFEQTVLLLQGGGALGSYQAGVYQALAEANLHPDWVAGISIGAVNSALIAGSPPEKRVEKLREFWEAVSTSPLGLPYFSSLTIS